MTKLIVTLGPSTNRKADLLEMKKIGVDYVRANMSHTSCDDLEKLIELSKQVGIPFILDTEGPQVRTGHLVKRKIPLRENDTLALTEENVIGDQHKVSIRPENIIKNLHIGDQLHFDGNLLLRIVDDSNKNNGTMKALVVNSGRIGENKGIAIDSVHTDFNELSTLSSKDLESIELGLSMDVKAIAVSFVRNAEDIKVVKEATKGKMKIISKVECQYALDNLKSIIENSDGIIIDRHDLCKEIPREKIFSTQKKIFDLSTSLGKPAFASSYMLESMVDNDFPTEHERYNAIATIQHGANGLVLSAETTIGAYPLKAIQELKKIIKEAEETIHQKIIRN